MSVSETGQGMDAEKKEQIFDPFFTTKYGEMGAGLGMPVALGIVGRHGGQIEVESSPGRGSTFTIYLPIEKEVEG